MPRELRWVLLLWLVVGVAISVRCVVKPTAHTVLPVFATAADHWWADEPVYADYRPLDHFRYPPVYAIAMTPLAWLGPMVAGIVWGWLSLAVYGVGCVRFIREVIPRRWSVGRESLFLTLALFGGLRGLWNGQSNAIVIGLLLLGCAEIVAERWMRASLWLTAAVLVKLTPLAIVLLLVAARPRSLGLPVFALLLVGLLVPFATRPPLVVVEQYRGWWEQMRTTSSERWPGFRDAWTVWQVVRQPWTGETEVPLREPLTSLPYRALQLGVAGFVLLRVIGLARRGVAPRQLVTLTLALGSGWLLLFGPAVEHPTFVLLVPSLLWGLLDGRTHWLSGLCILVLGWGAIIEPLRPWCPALIASLPVGTALFLLPLLWCPYTEQQPEPTEASDDRTERGEPDGLSPGTRLGRVA